MCSSPSHFGIAREPSTIEIRPPKWVAQFGWTPVWVRTAIALGPAGATEPGADAMRTRTSWPPPRTAQSADGTRSCYGSDWQGRLAPRGNRSISHSIYWLDDRTPKQASPRYPPMGVASKAARITALPATIPRDKYVLLATVASSIS